MSLPSRDAGYRMLTYASQCIVAALVSSLAVVAAQAQTSGGPFQVGYASNLNIGTSFVNLSNGSGSPICANIYMFTPDETDCLWLLFRPCGWLGISLD